MWAACLTKHTVGPQTEPSLCGMYCPEQQTAEPMLHCDNLVKRRCEELFLSLLLLGELICALSLFGTVSSISVFYHVTTQLHKLKQNMNLRLKTGMLEASCLKLWTHRAYDTRSRTRVVFFCY